jgi:hypothetical protein
MCSKTEARRFDDHATAKLGVYMHVYGSLATAKAGPPVPSSAILGLAVAGLGHLTVSERWSDPVITRALQEYIIDLRTSHLLLLYGRTYEQIQFEIC